MRAAIRLSAGVLVLAVAVVLRAMWGSHAGAPSAPPVRDPGQVESPEVPDGAFRAVDDRVVDGDTFLARVSGAGRDLRVRIPADKTTRYGGGTDKINAAFEYGYQNGGGRDEGLALLAETVSDLTSEVARSERVDAERQVGAMLFQRARGEHDQREEDHDVVHAMVRHRHGNAMRLLGLGHAAMGGVCG